MITVPYKISQERSEIYIFIVMVGQSVDFAETGIDLKTA